MALSTPGPPAGCAGRRRTVRSSGQHIDRIGQAGGGGKFSPSAARVSAFKRASFSLCASSRSTAVTPGPPALVRTARRPAGSGHQASAGPVEQLLGRFRPDHPERWKAALNASSEPASAPVCGDRSLAAGIAPDQGDHRFLRETRRACSTKRRPLLTLQV
jgi:hypothetical protein